MNSQKNRVSENADDAIRELFAVADQDSFEPGQRLFGRVQTSLSAAIDSNASTILNSPPPLQTVNVLSQSGATAERLNGRKNMVRRLSRWTTACALLVCLALASVSLLRPPEVLGQVLSALRSQSRVHVRCQDVHGNDIEAWISSERYAVKRMESSFLLDRTKQTVDTWYPTKQRIVRSVPSFTHAAPEFGSLLELLKSIPGNMTEIGGMKVESMKAEPGKNGDSNTMRHSIELATGPSALNSAISMSLDVVTDNATNLPSECTATIRQTGLGQEHERTVKMTFDYPRDEPQTIQDLGASETAALVDTTNPESDPLYAKVQSAMERGRRGLKEYRALVGTDPASPHWVIWRSGRKWRVDYTGVSKAIGRISDEPGMTPPDVDVTHWQDQFLNGGQSFNVFDGQDLWYRNADQLVKQTLPPFAPQQLRDSQWIGGMTLERLAYPLLGEEDGFVLTITEESPGGLVLAEYSAVAKMDDLAHRTRRYWLNPEYGYAVVKSEFTDATGSDETFNATHGSRKHMVSLNARFEQSPSGIWCPTRTRAIGKQAFLTLDKPVLDDDWMCYHVDFSSDVPGSLFEVAK